MTTVSIPHHTSTLEATFAMYHQIGDCLFVVHMRDTTEDLALDIIFPNIRVARINWRMLMQNTLFS